MAGKGELIEQSPGYSFLRGRAPDDKREAGVGYAFNPSFVSKLASPYKEVNDRLMTMRLQLHHGKKFTTIFRTYVPTMTNRDETKDKFYEDFEYVTSAVPAESKLIILDDNNIRVW